LALQYHKSGELQTCYSDSDWAGNCDDKHSTPGNLLISEGVVICWTSKKQPVVALSTAESENFALSSAAQKAAWLHKLLADLQVPSQPILLKEDNQGAIYR